MKRVLSVLVLVLVLCLVPVTALASKPKADVGFDGTYKHGQPVLVTDFTYYSVGLKCKEGPATASNSGSPLPEMKVNDQGVFKGRFNDAGTKTVVKGKYNRALTKVTGTLRVKGNYSGYTACDSGKLKWVTN
jgi:hypothetical protein